MNETILVIVNPASGKRNGIKTWASIKPLLVNAEIDFHCVLTTQEKDATHFTKSHIEKGLRTVLVIGGDGTLNEVVNGIMTQKACPSQQVRLAIIPNGTGNDFYRNFKKPKSKLVEALKSNTTPVSYTHLTLPTKA